MLDSKTVVFIPSGAGAPGFGGIAACLREDPNMHIVSGDMQSNAYGKQLSDRFYVMPPSNSEMYIPEVLKIAKAESVNVILPITTQELWALSRAQSLLTSNGVHVIISPEKALEIANNKGKLHAFASAMNIDVPEGGVVEDIEQFEALATKMLLKHDRLFFKPVTGNGSRGIGIVTKNRVENWSLAKPDLMPLSLSEWLIRFEGSFNTPLLLTEYLPGKEYSVDTFIFDEDEAVIIPRTRDKMVSGISVAGVFEKHDAIIDQSRKLISAIGLEGPIGIQWKLDHSGIPKLLEINPRLQGTTSTLRHLDINIPLIAVKNALGQAYKLPENIDWGRSFTRYWQDVFL